MPKRLVEQSLDRNSPVPLYHQLKQIVVDTINSGQLQPGDIVPSENDLAAVYHVSRTTIRQAMAELEQEGYIYRQRGKFTMVSGRPVYHGATGMAGFGDDMRSQGIVPWSKVLGVSIVCADASMAARLSIDEGDEVVVAHRLRLADDRPACIEWSHLPVERVGLVSPRDIDGEKSLYAHLRERRGIYPQAVEETVEVVYASAEDASLLGIPVNSPVVRLCRTVYTEANECIEYAISLWRVDRFRYAAWRSGSSHLTIRDLESDRERMPSEQFAEQP